MLKRLGKSKLAHQALGFVLAAYIRFVRRTNRFEQPSIEKLVDGKLPVIVAMWHGQHFMIPYARPTTMHSLAALISRHADAGANEAALRWLNIIPIRGSGGRAERMRKKGGAEAMREMLRALADGTTVAMTADVPKRARVAGLGIVTLARLSGRPIAPVAVVTSRRLQFKSWDRASIGKPFGRGVIVVSDFVTVPPDADDATMEALRKKVEDGLDDAHRRAYAKFGAPDPGAGLRRD
jgi:lysophospholipid acyltransferase (LPLAT)-like uncharacterized protein